MISLQSYLIVAAAVFCLGLYNIMTRKNAVAILMGIELILNSANINFIAFSSGCKSGAPPRLELEVSNPTTFLSI